MDNITKFVNKKIVPRISEISLDLCTCYTTSITNYLLKELDDIKNKNKNKENIKVRKWDIANIILGATPLSEYLILDFTMSDCFIFSAIENKTVDELVEAYKLDTNTIIELVSDNDESTEFDSDDN